MSHDAGAGLRGCLTTRHVRTCCGPKGQSNCSQAKAGGKVSKGTEIGKRRRKSSKSTGRRKAKGKPQSSRGATQKARERAAGFVPNPHVAVIASDPLKAQIVAVAIQRLYSPSEFAREAGVALNVASYAFKVLKEKGIIELVDTVKVRGSTLKHMYRATESALIDEADWGALAAALRPIFAGTILQDFSGRVTQAIETGHLFSRDDFCLYWAPACFDEIAWLEQVEIINWCIEEFERLKADTVNRRASGDGAGSFHTTFAIASFPSPTHEEFTKHKAKRKGKPKGQVEAKDMCRAKGSPRKSKSTGSAKARGATKGKGRKK